MIRKSVSRFSEKIVLNQEIESTMTIARGKSRCKNTTGTPDEIESGRRALGLSFYFA
jgi:hypothetical protein